MRKLLLIFATTLSLLACAQNHTPSPTQPKFNNLQKYIDAKEQCDQTAKHELKFGDLTTAGMANSVDNQIDCYKKVAHTIIDKHYSQTAAEMKQNLDEFAASAYDVSLDMNMPDDCYPMCGTIITNLQRSNTLHLVDKYIDDLIESLDWRLNG